MKPSSTTSSALTKESPRTLLSYLPDSLLESASLHTEPTWYEWLDGSLMHCDISGFTAMSEDLAGRGKEGAELMVGVLNRFFETMLGIAADYGGVQMKFGGDAMLLYFGGKDHALRAAACGLAMQRAMRSFAKVHAGGGTYRLRMRAGIHSGRFFSACAGDPGQLLHYVITGADVSKAAIVEASAGLGQVVCTAATGALIRGSRLRPHGDGLLHIGQVGVVPLVGPSQRLHPEGYERYLPPAVRDGRTVGSGEHRRVTIVFINVLGMDLLLEKAYERDVLDVLNRYVVLLLASLERHHGYLLGSDVADHGDKFITLFGAPIADERQEAAAMRFALDVQAAVKEANLPLKLRTGINTGYAFAGEVGSSGRHEYTVIGDNVNLAARLMSAAADGEVIVSASTAERVRALFDLKSLRPIRVKGKKEPVRISRLLGAAEPSVLPSETRLVGRARELKALLRLAREAAAQGQAACITGEPGIGKSALLAAVASYLARSDWDVIRAACQPHTSGTPFALWQEIAGQLVRRQDDVGIQARAPTNFIRTTPGADDDPRAFRAAALAAIESLIDEAGRSARTALLIEDVHWADDSSLIAMGEVMRRAAPNTLICLTSREPVEDVPVSRSYQLTPLSLDAAQELVASSGVMPEDSATILARAQGNPLFLREYLRVGAHSGELPDTVNDLMMARIDTLLPQERQVLRTASVIGLRFEQPFLVRLAEPLSAHVVAEALPALTVGGFTLLESSKPPTFTFAHALLSDAAYESAPFAFRRRMHARAGELIEVEHEGDLEPVAELLLHHFERAGNWQRTVRYAAISGERAARRIRKPRGDGILRSRSFCA